MSLEVNFVQSIIESPDDENLRRIYADWLEEQGRKQRATELRGESVYCAHHFQDEYPWIDSFSTWMGFARAIWCSLGSWLDCRMTLLREQPIRDVHILEYYPDYCNFVEYEPRTHSLPDNVHQCQFRGFDNLEYVIVPSTTTRKEDLQKLWSANWPHVRLHFNNEFSPTVAESKDQ